jgi:cyclase
MSLLRFIARLDIKGPNVIKGVRMEGLRVMGNPVHLALKYAHDADELLYIDTVASLYGRNQLERLLEETSQDVFIPITVVGGISTIAECKRLFRSGADKIGINTAAIANPALINELAQTFGSQAVVVSIEAKRVADGWEAYTNCGREKTGKDAIKWAFEAIERGAGELLVTAVDRDGTCKGFDVELISQIAPNSTVPVIAAGGFGNIAHIFEVLDTGRADAVAIGTMLHAKRGTTMKEIKYGYYAQRQLQAEERRRAAKAAV